MGAVAEVVSDVFEPIGNAVGQVEKAIESAASEIGHVVQEVGTQVGKTVEAMAKDPAKALPLIAVAILAPELAPLLWEGATAAEAAMVLNTGMQLAQGADPMTIAQNLATSAATMGVTQGLDISTGFNPADKAIGSALSAAAQGQDVNKAIGSSIGNSIIGAGVGAGKEAFADNGSQDNGPAQSYSDLSKEMTADNAPAKIDNDAITTSQTFRDAIYNGFSPEEAYAIAQGQADAGASGASPYEPTAGTTTSDQPAPLVSKEQLDQDLADQKITQEEYDKNAANALDTSKAEQEYVDPQAGLEAAPSTEPAAPAADATKDALGATPDAKGNLQYTYDDGSTLTLSPDGEVIDVTEATDTGEYTDNYQEEEDTTGKKGSGFSVKLGSGNKGRTSGAQLARKGLVSASTSGSSTSPTSSTGGLDSLGGEQYSPGLTANVSKGNADYSLMGELPTDEQPSFATGGSTGVYDLSTTASSPFLGGGNADIMALKPGLVKGKVNYALPGYPFGQEWKAAKAGGAIQNAPEGHNPQFFSEGGLGAMKNTYVKGDGDGTSDSIAAMLANGEFVIPADVVSSLGNGSNDSGAKILDEFLQTIRAHKRKADPKGLPPDSKGALSYLAAAKKKAKK
jgi:hypothetical protein